MHLRSAAKRAARTTRGMWDELAWGTRTCADPSSLARYVLDVFLYRVLSFVDLGGRRLRRIRLRDGTVLTYRLNRGDIRLIAEIFGLEIYGLPRGFRDLTLIDLGANVGFASVYFAARYGVAYTLAVEPSAESAEVLHTNLRENGITGTVVQAAVGAQDGPGFYAVNEHMPSIGMLSDVGEPVDVIRMNTLLDRLPTDDVIDVLKLDIEGAEAAVFGAEDLSWLNRVRLIFIELHPTLIDVERVIDRLRALGFDYVPLDRHPSAWMFENVMAVFVRPGEGIGRSELRRAVA